MFVNLGRQMKNLFAVMFLVSVNVMAMDIDPSTGFPVNAIPKSVEKQLKNIERFDAVEHGVRDLTARGYVSTGNPTSPTGVTSYYTPNGIYTVSRAGSVTFVGRSGQAK